MSRGAMAFLAGMGTGYMNGEKEKRNQARQDKIDSQRDELHGAKMGEIKRENDDRTALKYAGETVTARPLDGPQPESAYVNGQEPTQPIGYIAGNGASARTFAGNGVGQEQAAANAMEQNKPEARRTRMADLAMQGNTLAGAALRDNVQTDAALGQLKEQKELQGQREFGRGLATAAATGGWKGSAQFATEKYNDGNNYRAEEDGKGGAIMIATGKDGKEIGRMPFKSLDEYIMFGVSKANPEKWVDYKMGRADKETDQANKDRDFDLRKKESESTAEYRKRTLAIQGAQEARAGSLHRLAMEDAKIPPAVKLQATSLAKQMEGIGAALNKAMAEDNFNPQSDNAKALLKQQARLGDQYQALLAGYTPGAKVSENPFKLGEAKPAAAPAAAPVARPVASPVVTQGQPAAPQAQQFNEAGYASVQSTIDGARRGDARARALLGVMIDQGVTTPAQRMQIYEISK